MYILNFNNLFYFVFSNGVLNAFMVPRHFLPCIQNSLEMDHD